MLVNGDKVQIGSLVGILDRPKGRRDEELGARESTEAPRWPDADFGRSSTLLRPDSDGHHLQDLILR